MRDGADWETILFDQLLKKLLSVVQNKYSACTLHAAGVHSYQINDEYETFDIFLFYWKKRNYCFIAT